MSEQAVYVCGACGKMAYALNDFTDVSCFMNAVECDMESLVVEDGRVVRAVAVEES